MSFQANDLIKLASAVSGGVSVFLYNQMVETDDVDAADYWINVVDAQAAVGDFVIVNVGGLANLHRVTTITGRNATTGFMQQIEGIDLAALAQTLSIVGALIPEGGAPVAWSDVTGTPTTLVGYGITDAVALTGAQTIAGVKTFSSTPVLPAAVPTTANQATNKTYVDSRTLSTGAKTAVLEQNTIATDADLPTTVAALNALITALKTA